MGQSAQGDWGNLFEARRLAREIYPKGLGKPEKCMSFLGAYCSWGPLEAKTDMPNTSMIDRNAVILLGSLGVASRSVICTLVRGLAAPVHGAEGGWEFGDIMGPHARFPGTVTGCAERIHSA